MMLKIDFESQIYALFDNPCEHLWKSNQKDIIILLIFWVGRNPSFFCFYYRLFFSDKSCFFCGLKPFFLIRDFSSHFFSNKSFFSASKSFFYPASIFCGLYGSKQNLFFPYSKTNHRTSKSLLFINECCQIFFKF